MRRTGKIGLGSATLAALLLAGCSQSEQIRVYVEPTYEQDRLRQILALHPEVKLLARAGTEDVSLRVEAVPEERGAHELPRAVIRARARKSGYEVYAVAQFLRVRNARGGRARWVASFTEGVRESDVDEILFQVVREAARSQAPGPARPPEEVERALHSGLPSS